MKRINHPPRAWPSGGTDGLNDLLGPYGGTVNIGFVHPYVEPLAPEIIHEFNHLLLVFTGVTDKNIRAHLEPRI